ncbi:MAG TPA: nuclear transport factor 2 family protein [Steroidobacteraceae bacterium]|nr:nuclear transport factor 2 family protein [Steroidobacteraceae bacterium]
MRDTTAAGLESTIRTYFDGCNEANREKIIACMESDAVHYFPAGAPQGTFVGAKAIAEGWRRAVANLGSIWTIDRVIIDAPRLEAVIEWTHFKPKQGVYLRGDEWYVFSAAGHIREIRAYYACPTSPDPVMTHELGDFRYAELGYPLKPPAVKR